MQKPITVQERKSSGYVETLKTVVYAVAIALVVRTFAYEPFNIPSGSMKPTLLVGDYLFVSKFSYGYSRFSFPFGLAPIDGRIFGSLPERGDVVVFKLPADNRTDYIKRVVGLPGDKIQVVNGVLHINGQPVELQPAGTFREEVSGRMMEAQLVLETLPNGVSHHILDLTPTGPLDNTRIYEVPPGHIFAMGDNRDNSLDSRVDHVGYIPIENLIGRAEILFFSIDEDARLWEPWKWPLDIRYDRILQLIR
jgi:signal peptidase I